MAGKEDRNTGRKTCRSLNARSAMHTLVVNEGIITSTVRVLQRLRLLRAQVQPQNSHSRRFRQSLPLVELLQDLRTSLEMRRGFPSIVLVPIPCPLDQVLPPLFSLSPVPSSRYCSTSPEGFVMLIRLDCSPAGQP